MIPPRTINIGAPKKADKINNKINGFDNAVTAEIEVSVKKFKNSGGSSEKVNNRLLIDDNEIKVPMNSPKNRAIYLGQCGFNHFHGSQNIS